MKRPEDMTYEDYKLKCAIDKTQQRNLLKRGFVIHDNLKGIYNLGKNKSKRSK